METDKAVDQVTLRYPHSKRVWNIQLCARKWTFKLSDSNSFDLPLEHGTSLLHDLYAAGWEDASE